jgi:hypothetical protein
MTMLATEVEMPPNLPNTSLRYTALLLSVALFACGSRQSSSVPSVSSASGEEQTRAAAAAPPDLGWHMRATFWDAVRARDALIAGDLSAAQRSADQIVRTDYSRMLPADWKVGFGALQQHAAALSLAPNLAAAAQELGRMALACGECHEVRARGPGRTPTVPVPWEEPNDSWEERMQRHELAIVQMWDGLVLPSENAWRSGTVTITRAPLRAPELAGRPISPALHERIEATRGLAKQARLATTYQERGRVYGELIAGCAQCHYLQRPASNQP